MVSYLYQVHNLTGSSKFSRLSSGIKNAIVTLYQDSFNNLNDLEKALVGESSSAVLTFINNHLDIQKYYKNIVFTGKSRSYTEDVDYSNLRAIIDFKKVNNIHHVNGLFQAVNELLPTKVFTSEDFIHTGKERFLSTGNMVSNLGVSYGYVILSLTGLFQGYPILNPFIIS